MNASTKKAVDTVMYYVVTIGALVLLYWVSYNAGVKHGRRLERIELGLEARP